MLISKKIILFLSLGSILLVGHFIFAKIEAPKEPSAQDSSSKQNPTLKEQVGQMLILGFRGTQFQKNSFIDKAINDLKIGGVILFDYDFPSGVATRNIVNPEQVKKLTADLQNNSTIPLFIFTDTEMASSSKNLMVCGDPPTKERAVEMVQASCDLIIISNNVNSYDEKLPYQVDEAIAQAISKGEIATSSIEASYNKIIKLKKDFGIMK